MAALGVVNPRPNFPAVEATRLLVTDYDVVRGKYLGVVAMREAETPTPELNDELGIYIVRQISTVFRQLWPTHGQRFPQ